MIIIIICDIHETEQVLKITDVLKATHIRGMWQPCTRTNWGWDEECEQQESTLFKNSHLTCHIFLAVPLKLASALSHVLEALIKSFFMWIIVKSLIVMGALSYYMYSWWILSFKKIINWGGELRIKSKTCWTRSLKWWYNFIATTWLWWTLVDWLLQQT